MWTLNLVGNPFDLSFSREIKLFNECCRKLFDLFSGLDYKFKENCSKFYYYEKKVLSKMLNVLEIYWIIIQS